MMKGGVPNSVQSHTRLDSYTNAMIFELRFEGNELKQTSL